MKYFSQQKVENVLRDEEWIRGASTSQACWASTLQMKEVHWGAAFFRDASISSLVTGASPTSKWQKCFFLGQTDFSCDWGASGTCECSHVLVEEQTSFFSVFPSWTLSRSVLAAGASVDQPKLTSVSRVYSLQSVQAPNRAETQSISWEGEYGFHNNRAKLGESQLACPKHNAS